MKISKAGIIAALAVLVLGISACRVGSPGVSDPGRTETGSKGNGDSVTLMVYMIGSDLESMNGCASDDINEMIEAAPGKNVHVILETGGSNAWRNYGISGDKIQRWELSGSGLTLKEELDHWEERGNA